jgi:hypothetical protein
MLVALMLTTWSLVLLGLFDLFSLVVSFAGLALSRSVIARRLSPVRLIREAWRQMVIRFLDLLDDLQAFAAVVRTLPSRGVRWLRRRLPRGPDVAWIGSYGAVVLGSGALRLIDILAHPSPAAGNNYLQRIDGVVAVGARRMPSNDLHGMDLLLGSIARLVTVDPTMLVRIAPAVVAGFVSVSLIVCLRHWSVSHGSVLIAAVVVGLAGVASWLPPLGGEDLLGIETALAAALPAFVFSSQAIATGTEWLGGRGERRRLAAASVGVAVFLHPAAGTAVFVCLVLGVVVSWAMSQRESAPSVRLSLWLLAGEVLGLAPLVLVGLARGDITAPLRSILTEVGSGSGEFPVAAPPSWPVVLLASICAVGLTTTRLPLPTQPTSCVWRSDSSERAASSLQRSRFLSDSAWPRCFDRPM